jgi:hypothetical protein
MVFVSRQSSKYVPRPQTINQQFRTSPAKVIFVQAFGETAHYGCESVMASTMSGSIQRHLFILDAGTGHKVEEDISFKLESQDRNNSRDTKDDYCEP